MPEVSLRDHPERKSGAGACSQFYHLPARRRRLTSQVIFFDMGQTLTRGAEQSPRRLMGSVFDLSEKEVKKVGRLIMTHPAVEPSLLMGELKSILIDREEQHLRKGLEDVWAEQCRCVKEIGGAASVLRSLKTSGFKLGLLSNTWHPLYSSFCTMCPELAELVDYSVLSYRIGLKKPSRELFRRAVAQTGLSPDSCWMVGDSYELDIEPALAVGMHAIWVLHGPEREKTLLAQVLRGEKPRPDWAVSHLEEIPTFFSSKGLL